MYCTLHTVVFSIPNPLFNMYITSSSTYTHVHILYTRSHVSYINIPIIYLYKTHGKTTEKYLLCPLQKISYIYTHVNYRGSHSDTFSFLVRFSLSVITHTIS